MAGQSRQIAKYHRNFLKYGKVNPTAIQRIGGFFGSLTRKKDIPLGPGLNQFLGFGSVIENSNKSNYIEKGWNKSATVYSIVRKIAKTCSYAPWGAYKIVDEQSFKRYKAMSAQHQTASGIKATMMIRQKALEPVNDRLLNDLMDHPNPTMSGSEYIEGLFTYKLLTGDAYEWGVKLDSGNDRGKPQQLWLLPSQYVDIETSIGGYPQLPVGYVLNEGQPKHFDPEEILHIKYFNPNYSSIGNHLYGFSPLQAAWLSIQEDNSAKDAAIEMLQNRGPRGVLSMEGWTAKEMTAQMAKEQAGLLKERFRQELIEGKGGIVTVAGKASYVSIGLNIADLKILEISDYTMRDICNVYGVWEGLFNSNSDSTNGQFKVEQFKKDFILNTVLTELNSLKSSRNHKLQTDWGYKGSGIVLDYDPTVYMELQDDLKEMAEWLERAWWYTGNEKRVYMNDNESDNPMMNEILVPQNLIPLSDLGADVSELPEMGLSGE